MIAIVAASEDNVIGIDDEMPWRLPDDFKYFKETTMGYPMIMGKTTWFSLGGQPLSGRPHWIISRSFTTDNPLLKVFSSPEAAVAYAKTQNEELVYIIGGGSIYRQMLPYTDEILLTRIHATINGGQVFFPEIREGGWKKVWEKYHPKDERHPMDFTFERWIREEAE